MNVFWTIFSKFCLKLLSLRYRIRISGVDLLDGLSKEKGILFLPNHPALLDPLFLFLFLWSKYKMRPLVAESVFQLPFLRPLFWLIKALSIPDFDTSINQLKVKRAEKTIQEISDGLKNGEKFILYPSGQLKSKGREIIGGASGAHALVQESPDVQIVLVRTTGLWGSSFSRAIEGRSPDILKTVLRGIKIVFKNGIFFCPRRDVEIQIETQPSDFPRKSSRIEFNRYLENWYNRYPDGKGKLFEEEPLKLVSYSFWKNEVLEPFKPKQKKGNNNGIKISEKTRDKIYAEFRRILDNSSLEISPEKNLSYDLGMDSLNIADVLVFLAREYDVEELHPDDIETVQDVLDAAEGGKFSKDPHRHSVKFHWPDEGKRPSPLFPGGKTISEAFLKSCDRMDGFSACGDDLHGVMSYKKLKRAALVLATYFKTFPEKRVAVLLPSSVGAYIVILALELAGKVPVMLNWTLGPRYLDEMMSISDAKRVLSSWRFLDRLSHVEFGSLIDKFELLEDVRKKLSLKMKLKGTFLSLRSTSSILRSLDLEKIDENDPCVILFTSGTEASPKGVPLSHKNILSNLSSVLKAVDLRADDIIYGILPPFHSFGFSVVGLFLFLSGIKVAYYPDPTDSASLAEGIERWKITLFCGAPSFLRGVFQVAKSKDTFKSVRLFVSGAEKAPPELFDWVKNLGTGAKLIEGYGITECSPCLSFGNPDLPPRGVGNLFPDVELCTIHPETEELLPQGKEGEICVRGPNIFKGYLGNVKNPFIEIEGKQWYRTGDIGYLEPDGCLIISGRLKRFTKVGGEMISLGAVEEILIQEFLKRGRFSPEDRSLAVCADERSQDKSQLILFSTIQIEKEEANEILKNSGLSRLIKISDVKKIEEIPLMGTGKTDYRKLQSFLG